MAKRKKEIVLENIEITDVAAEGKVIAKVDGTVVFVEFGVPGDIVDIKVTRKKKKYMEGYILNMIKPSEHRLEPFCKHFGLCGGCKWQQLPYAMQLKAKQQQVYDQLIRIGHLDIPEISPITPSDETIYYRNKLEFTFSQRRWILNGEDYEALTDKERLGLGFHVARFFDKVLDIKCCYLQKDPSNAIRLFVKDYALENDLTFFNIREQVGFLRNMVIRTTEAGNVMLIMVFYHEDIAARKALLDAVAAKFPQITSLYYVINKKANDSIADQECVLYRGEDAIYEYMEGLIFKIGPKSFYQTNTKQAYKLYCIAREFAKLTGKEVVYDLYTGTGTIAQFISKDASKVIGIEYVPEAIEDARLNSQTNNITNCEFYAGDMKDILTDAFVKEHGRPDVIILDPPRAGIHPDVAQVILNSEPERIVYVSCNPASQARDLKILSQDYKITAVRPIDMFPHTHHVENVVVMERRIENREKK